MSSVPHVCIGGEERLTLTSSSCEASTFGDFASMTAQPLCTMAVSGCWLDIQAKGLSLRPKLRWSALPVYRLFWNSCDMAGSSRAVYNLHLPRVLVCPQRVLQLLSVPECRFTLRGLPGLPGIPQGYPVCACVRRVSGDERQKRWSRSAVFVAQSVSLR